MFSGCLSVRPSFCLSIHLTNHYPDNPPTNTLFRPSVCPQRFRAFFWECMGEMAYNWACWCTVYPKKYAHGFCFAVLCCGYIHWLIFPYPYPSGLLHWHCGNLTIAPVPAKQTWWIWINTSYEFIMNDCITTTKQSITKPCAYFLGYTVSCLPSELIGFRSWLVDFLILVPFWIHETGQIWGFLAISGECIGIVVVGERRYIYDILRGVLSSCLYVPFIFSRWVSQRVWAPIQYKDAVLPV